MFNNLNNYQNNNNNNNIHLNNNKINIIIKSINNKNNNLTFQLSLKTKIKDLKNLIYLEDIKNNKIKKQKIIIKGRIPDDNDIIESYIFNEIEENIPLIFHLALIQNNNDNENDSDNDNILDSSLDIDKYIEPMGLTFDEASLQEAKKWIEKTKLEEDGTAYINARSTLLVADILKARNAIQGATDSTNQPTNNVANPAEIPVQPAVNNQPALVMPRIIQFDSIFRIFFLLLFLKDLFPSIYWAIAASVLYYFYISGWIEYILRRFRPSLFQPHQANPTNQPQESLSQRVIRLLHVPRSPGPVMDIYAFLSSFIFSLFPSWEAA